MYSMSTYLFHIATALLQFLWPWPCILNVWIYILPAAGAVMLFAGVVFLFIQPYINTQVCKKAGQKNTCSIVVHTHTKYTSRPFYFVVFIEYAFLEALYSRLRTPAYIYTSSSPTHTHPCEPVCLSPRLFMHDDAHAIKFTLAPRDIPPAPQPVSLPTQKPTRKRVYTRTSCT